MRAEKMDRSPSNLMKWFELRGLDTGTFAFIMNRISGIGLTVYLFMHLIVLSQLARGSQAYNGFIAFAKNPVFVAGEYLVVAAVLLHGLNGLRIAITSFGIGASRQKSIFYPLMLIALAGCIVFALRMFGGE